MTVGGYNFIIKIEATIPITPVTTRRAMLMMIDNWIADRAKGFLPSASMLFAIDLEKVKKPKVKLRSIMSPAATNRTTLPICLGSCLD